MKIIVSNFNIKSQKAKTWDFSFKFLYKSKKIQYFYKDNPLKYKQEMTAFGKWTRDNLIDLGPTFIKLGQVLSTRKDVFSNEFILELERLQDDVKPMTNDEINNVLNTE